MPQLVEANSPIADFLAKHQTIRALPENSTHILRVIRDPSCDTTQLLKLIAQDAALAAQIMKAVNSSFYSLQTKATRLDQAVAYMGLTAVKEVVVTSSMAQLCKNTPIGNYTGRDLWDHSVKVAILCREFAARSKTIDYEDAFLAGMLHDIGLLLIAQSEVGKTAELFAVAESRTSPFTSQEQRVFGFDHCELGEHLSQSWRFPSHIAAAVRWHHDPLQAPAEYRALCAHIYIADTACGQLPTGFSLTSALQENSSEILAMANLSAEAVADVIQKLPLLLRLHNG